MIQHTVFSSIKWGFHSELEGKKGKVKQNINQCVHLRTNLTGFYICLIYFWNSFCLFFLFNKLLLTNGWVFFFFFSVLLSRVTYPSVKGRHRSCVWFIFCVGKLTDQSNSFDFILVFSFPPTPFQMTKNLFYQLTPGVESEKAWDSVCVCIGDGELEGAELLLFIVKLAKLCTFPKEISDGRFFAIIYI